MAAEIGQISAAAARYLPEPAVHGVGMFRDVMSGLLRAGEEALGGDFTVSIDPKYEALIREQMRVQEQMQNTSMISNIEKSKHESKMSAIRNIRVG